MDTFLEDMTYVFNHAVNKTLKTVPLFLTVILLRILMKHVPKRVHVALWSIAALGLLLPTGVFPSRFTLTPSATPVPYQIVYAQKPQVDTGVPVMDSAVNPLLTQFETDGSDSVTPLYVVQYIATIIWLCGIAILAVYAAGSTLRLRLRLRGAVRDASGKRVFTSKACPTPFLLGILLPRIYLPENLPEEDRSAVLLHEHAHLKRLDHIRKLIWFMIAAYYWFNPLVWVGWHLLTKDIELACDERVIRKMDAPAKKSYAEALLRCSLPEHPKAACPLAFGEVAVRTRIAAVAAYHKPVIWQIALASLTVPLTAFGFLTDPYPARYIPDRDMFIRTIQEETPRTPESDIRVCNYLILDSAFEPFYDQRKISYHYTAVLVRDYRMQDGEPVLVSETFSPVFMGFKHDWLRFYVDLEREIQQPAYSAYSRLMQFHTLFPDIDLSGENWRINYKADYAALSAGCQPPVSGSADNA